MTIIIVIIIIYFYYYLFYTHLRTFIGPKGNRKMVADKMVTMFCVDLNSIEFNLYQSQISDKLTEET